MAADISMNDQQHLVQLSATGSMDVLCMEDKGEMLQCCPVWTTRDPLTRFQERVSFSEERNIISPH